MVSHEMGTHLPALPLASTEVRQERRLLRGASEQAVVRVLVAQRDRYCQSNGQGSLCLTQDALLGQLGLVGKTPEARRQAVRALRQTIWRVNPKLATQNLIIAVLHCFGQNQYAIFSLEEVWVAEPHQVKV